MKLLSNLAPHIRVLACVVALLSLASAPACFSAQASGGVSPSRIQKLRRGVNIPHWFWAAPDLSQKRIESYFTAKDAQLLRKAGIGCVRLPVEISFLADWKSGKPLQEEHYKLLNAALHMLTENGLAVMVCPFGDFQDKVSEAALTPNGEKFWETLAKRLGGFDPESLFLEVTNEPAGKPADWEPVQKRLLTAMRRGAPRHTLVTATTLISGREKDPWHTADALAEMTPVADANVVYNFHFYEPFWFTHQGATWAGPAPIVLRDVPYPSTPENVSALVAKLKAEVTDPSINWIGNVIRDYGAQRWNAGRIEAQMKPAFDWAAKHKVPLIVNEFGVYRQYAEENDRLAWIRDVRTVLEKHGVGWAMWDYSGGFSLALGDPGSRRLDEKTLAALTGR